MPKITRNCLDQLNQAIPLSEILEPSKNGQYCCPFCGSGHGPHKSGAVTVDKKKNIANCHSCDTGFNAIQAIQERDGLEFIEAAQYISREKNVPLEYEEEAGTPKKGEPKPVEEDITDPPEEEYPNTPNKYKFEFMDWTEDVDKAREYLHSRGIGDEVIKEYHLGYKLETFHDDNGKKVELPAVVFCYNTDFSYYSARALEGRYFNKPDKKEAGSEPVFNPGALNDEDPVFVTEAPLDCLSIIEAEGQALATCGTGWSKLLPYLRIRESKSPLILCFDKDKPNDKGHRPGQEAQAALAKELAERGIKYREAIFTYSKYRGEKKDCNDLLRSNPEQFKKDIAANIAAAKDPTGINAFLFETSTEKFRPIPTGIKSIDDLLCGGFIPQCLVLVGGEAGSGKTIIVAQIIESMAATGRRCLYFNLEMAASQLLARSISRRVYIKNNRYKLTALDILQGYKLTETQKQLVREAAEEYREEVGETLLYNPIPGASLDAILDYLRKEGDRAQREGVPAPCVAIDYIHLLQGDGKEETQELLKRAVRELKNYAIEYDTIVIAIQATSREANKRKGARIDAGRDSSALEYSGDLVIQIKRDSEIDAEDETHLCITKSRFTKPNIHGYKYRIHGGQSFMEAIPENDDFEKVVSTPYKD